MNIIVNQSLSIYLMSVLVYRTSILVSDERLYIQRVHWSTIFCLSCYAASMILHCCAAVFSGSHCRLQRQLLERVVWRFTSECRRRGLYRNFHFFVPPRFCLIEYRKLESITSLSRSVSASVCLSIRLSVYLSVCLTHAHIHKHARTCTHIHTRTRARISKIVYM